jgi:hypothetical protein
MSFLRLNASHIATLQHFLRAVPGEDFGLGVHRYPLDCR